MKASTSRPFPFALLGHWIASYALVWILLGAVIFIIQSVLSAFLHERDDIVRMLEMFEKAPFFKAFIGGDSLMPTNVLGIIAIGYQHPIVLTSLMINAVTIPTGLLTAQAEQGLMEHLLARPVTRSRIYFMVAGISYVSQAFLVCVLLFGTSIWTRYFDYGERIELGGFVDAAINLAAMSWAVVSISLLASVFFNERGRAVAVLVGFFVGSYLLHFSIMYLPGLKFLRFITIYNYCDPNKVLNAGGPVWTDLAVLGGITIVCLTSGWFIWRRRDLFAA